MTLSALATWPVLSLSDLASSDSRPNQTSPVPTLVFKAHRLVYHSTLGLRVIKKKTKSPDPRCSRTGTRAELVKHEETCPEIEIDCGSPGCLIR